MKAINRLLIPVLAGFLICSCDDIIEHDITNDTVQLVSPLDGAQVESNVVAFKWNTLEYADKYRIQVYGANQAISLDSVVTNNHITIPMSPGTYNWRVRGENSAYVSTYAFPATFTLIESSDLESQQVILSSPSTSLYTNNNTLTCTWEALPAAETYTFELVNVTEGNIVVHHEEDITGTSFLLDSSYLADDAQYQWKVKAVNSLGATQYSARSLYKDTVLPNTSVNTLPANNAIQVAGQQVSFAWSEPSDTGTIQSPISYVLEVSNDTAFSSIILTSAPLITNSYQSTFTATGEYYWRVRAKDQAGNQGSNSAAFKFTVN
ncbi:MAG: hypothetical protein EOO01_00190 [Chitinophagaceae bacterium]|nr:MAG: hypothetical protein EOO01_00190 [Chitinophagaceae bacterium]